MNRLEHVNLIVKSIEPTLAFVRTALPTWHVRGAGSMQWKGGRRNWVHVGTDDFYLTLNDGGEGSIRENFSNAPGLAHIGIVVNDVDATVARLHRSGYREHALGADHPFRKTIYFIDPAGIQFEFMQYFSELPAERNLYGGETSNIQLLNISD